VDGPDWAFLSDESGICPACKSQVTGTAQLMLERSLMLRCCLASLAQTALDHEFAAGCSAGVDETEFRENFLDSSTFELAILDGGD